MSHLSKTTKRRRVDEELNCIFCILNLQGEDIQCSHGEILKQTDSTNISNISDIPHLTEPCQLNEGTFIQLETSCFKIVICFNSNIID